MYLKPYHNDRSLSLDSPNQIAHLLSNSPAPTTVKQTASKHPSYPPRYVPFKNVTNNDSLRNILSGPNISMASPSPSQTSFNTIRSPSMTALLGPTEGNNTKRKMHARTKSAYPDKENDYEKSIMIAVRAAHNLQAEKEKDFAQEKITLEGDVLLQTRLMEILLQRVSANREVNEQYRANLEENLEKAQDLLEKTVINSDSVWIDLPLDFTQWNESVKGLSVSNTNLKTNIERLLGSEFYNKKNKALDKLRDSEKELVTLIEQVGVLLHKMRDAEEKERQMKECKQMAEEDIYSHVVAVTESIFIQEEASDVIDTLSWKDPQAFECIKNEIDLDNKLMELERDLENQTRELDYKIQNFNRDQLELNNKKERSHNCMESIALLVEKIRALEREMFDPRTNILTRLVQSFKSMNIKPKDCNSILEYLRIFEFGAGCGPTDKMLLVQYQKEVLDEVLFIIRQSQAISSMEAIFLSRGRRSASVLGERKSSFSTFESSGPAKELQNEIVNKKLELNEKLAVLRATKGRKIEKFEHIFRDKSTLTYHMENSFMEALKGLVDSSDKKIVEDIVLDVVGRAEAVWKAYLMIEEELNMRNKENRGIEESLDFLVHEIDRQSEIIESNKRTIAIKQEEVRIILDQLRALEDKYLQNEKKREEGDVGFGKDAKSEVMLERKQVKNRRGDSLTKLTRNFSAMENKISDLRKMKEEVIRAENLTRKLEQYRNTTLEKIESDLKVVLKRYAGQSAEFKMKVDLIQEELTLTLEQEEVVIRNIEDILYSKYNPESPENQDIIASMTLDIIMIRRFLGDLLKELRGRLLNKFTRNFLDGVELTCIELDEVKRINEKIERDELPYLEQENVKYTEIIEFEFNKCKELLEEKQERLAQLNKEREKYKNFCDISNELLRDKNQIPSKDSARLSVSLSSLQKDTFMHKSKSSSVIPNLVLHSRNLSILDSAKLSTKFDSNSLIPGSRDERDDKLNIDTFGVTKQQQNGRESGYATPKENTELQLESNWLRGMDIPSLDNSTTKTYNTSINYNNISLKSAHSDKITHFGYNSVPNEIKMPTTVKTDKIPRCLGVSEEEFKCLVTKFEKGFTVYKRFSATNKVEEKVSVTLSMKGKSKPKKDLIGYGKRVLRLNIKDKCIEVLKLGSAGLRTVIEYKYDWEDLKQVMIPQKTLEILREKQNTSNNKATTDAEDEIEEDAFVLKVSVDVVNKGRTDLILWDIPHVLALWNVVHRISLHGNLSLPLKN